MKMTHRERTMISRLLKQSILTLCREALSFEESLQIDGLICITADSQSDIVVKIHETLGKSVKNENFEGTSMSASWSNSRIDEIAKTISIDNRSSAASRDVRTEMTLSAERMNSNGLKSQKLKGIEKVQTHPSNDSVRSAINNGRKDIMSELQTTGASARESTCIPVKYENDIACDSPVQIEIDIAHHAIKTEVTETDDDNSIESLPDIKDNINLMDLWSPETTSKQKFSCSYCTFTSSSWLKYNKHILIHGPKKKYTCTHCEISFDEPFAYTSHLRKHKGDEMVNSFACCFCDVPLRSFYQFQNHEQSHIREPETCSICEKQFAYPYQLKKHFATHTAKLDPLNNTEVQHKIGVEKRYDMPRMHGNQTDGDSGNDAAFKAQTKKQFTKHSLIKKTALLKDKNTTVDNKNSVVANTKSSAKKNLTRKTHATHTQVDSIACHDSFSIYEEQTQDISLTRNPKRPNIFEEDTVMDILVKKNMRADEKSLKRIHESQTDENIKLNNDIISIYEEQTQVFSDTSILTPKPNRPRVFEEETVMDIQNKKKIQPHKKTVKRKQTREPDESAVFAVPRDRRAKIHIEEDEVKGIQCFDVDYGD